MLNSIIDMLDECWANNYPLQPLNLMRSVDLLRTQRKGMITNYEQYEFCYHVCYLHNVMDRWYQIILKMCYLAGTATRDLLFEGVQASAHFQVVLRHIPLHPILPNRDLMRNYLHLLHPQEMVNIFHLLCSCFR